MTYPQTHNVREVFSLCPVDLNGCNHLNPTPEYAGAKFDRWYKDVIRKAKAEAWEEGFDAGERDALDPDILTHECIKNPYTEES